MTPALAWLLAATVVFACLWIGWAVGYADFRARISTERTTAWHDGHDEGYRIGNKQGYAVGKEVGRASAPAVPASSLDPQALRTTTAAIRSARTDWLKFQLHGHESSYERVLRKLMALGISAGRRYLKGEKDGGSIAVPLADALNVCVRMAEVADEHAEQERLQQKHLGNHNGKPS